MLSVVAPITAVIFGVVTLTVIVLNVVVPASVVMLNAVYAECCLVWAECRWAFAFILPSVLSYML